MRILLLGKAGQVGWELQRALAPLGELVALDRQGDAAQGWCADLTQPQALADTVRRLQPQVIVNAAAYTAVDKAESEHSLAHQINAEAPGLLARQAAAQGAWLIHYSTDYVFDGSGDQPRDEDAPTAPLNVYGRSKRDGEEAIRAAGSRHLILRTSWVHGPRGGNFVRSILRLAGERERLTIVDDQIGAPTGAELIADVTAHLLRALPAMGDVGGTYHLAASGETSWCDYARFVVARALALGARLAVTPEGIAPIPTSAYPTPARRPLNSRLDTRRLRARFGLHLPDWRPAVDRLVTEIVS